jgi:tetratricopeptide (TPR) repeat protein
MWTAISAGSRSPGPERPQAAAAAGGPRGWFALIVAAGLLAGCGGARQVARPAPLEREIELNRTATAAFERGQRALALADYQEALRISRALEHVDGIAANLLNLAAVYRAAGDAEQAVRAADEVLAADRHAFAAAQRSAAAYVRALLFVDVNAFADASRLATQARALCREASCGNEGRIVNLQARTAFLAGELPAALALAREALRLNRQARAEEETANSLRIAADSQAGLGDLPSAHAGYTEALALDKQLGLPVKIGLDLVRLGDVAAGRARPEEARAYYRRALEVSRSAADESGMSAAAERLQGRGAPR